MKQKNYTEVLIDGTVYTLSGTENEMYLQKVAAYLSEKIGMIRENRGFGRLNADYQALMVELNVADDYFKAQEKADELAQQKAAMEKETYSLKHELITTQMRLEGMQKDLDAGQDEIRRLQSQIDDMRSEQEQQKAFQAAAAAANAQRKR